MDSKRWYSIKWNKKWRKSTDFISAVIFNPNFTLKEDVDINCETVEENGKTTVNCVNLTTGYLDATYTLEITISKDTLANL